MIPLTPDAPFNRKHFASCSTQHRASHSTAIMLFPIALHSSCPSGTRISTCNLPHSPTYQNILVNNPLHIQHRVYHLHSTAYRPPFIICRSCSIQHVLLSCPIPSAIDLPTMGSKNYSSCRGAYYTPPDAVAIRPESLGNLMISAACPTRPRFLGPALFPTISR